MSLPTSIDEQLLRNLAWIFTILSAVVSIALSINRFGLAGKKRFFTIAGVFLFGVAIAVLFISPLSPFKALNFLSSDQKEQIQNAHEEDGNRSSGYEVTDNGVTENSAGTQVNRISDYIYGVQHPDGKITAVYNGGFFDALVNGMMITCELIEIGKDRVLIIMGDELETVEIDSAQTETIFKVQKVPVSRPKE